MKRIETALEAVLFGSRWLLAPIYLGLSLSLVLLVGKFAVSAWALAMEGLFGSDDHLIVGVLSLIDISLMANLVLMVVLSGYENFVSRLQTGSHAEHPEWIGHVGFSEIKLKIMASIVAISAIHVLEDFMNAPTLADRDLGWRAGLHLLFIVSAVLLAWMDRLSPGAKDAAR